MSMKLDAACSQQNSEFFPARPRRLLAHILTTNPSRRNRRVDQRRIPSRFSQASISCLARNHAQRRAQGVVRMSRCITVRYAKAQHLREIHESATDNKYHKSPQVGSGTPKTFSKPPGETTGCEPVPCRSTGRSGLPGRPGGVLATANALPDAHRAAGGEAPGHLPRRPTRARNQALHWPTQVPGFRIERLNATP